MERSGMKNLNEADGQQFTYSADR